MHAQLQLKDIVKVAFVDRNPEVVSALAGLVNGHLQYCEFIVGDILKQPYGTLVSPANSFGDMNGGIDRAYKEYFPGIEHTLKEYIEREHGGELAIGRAQIIPTHDNQFPNIVFTPTIRTSNDLATPQTVYNAMVAALSEVVIFNMKMEDAGKSEFCIDKLLIPGFGTGFGRLNPETSANSMKKGYVEVEQNLHNLIRTYYK